jgi:hypothetical protein
MKIFKYIGIVAIVLLAVFLLVGVIKPSFEYTTSAVINAPRQQCWDVMQDTTQMKAWIPGFKTITLKSGQHQQQGAIYELIVSQDEVYVMSETVRAFREPEIIAFDLDNEVMKLAYEISFYDNGNQTIINGHYKATGNNVMWKSLLFLSKSYLQAGAQEQLALLKTLIEQPH